MNAPPPSPTPNQPAVNRRIEKKLRLMGDLFSFAMAVKTTQLRAKYPAWSEQAIRMEAVRLMDRANR